MIKNYKLDKTFSKAGVSAGIFLIMAGLIATYFSLIGLILVVMGLFFGFTSTGTIIDFNKKRIKFSNNLFGIIPIGTWINIKQGMKLSIKKSKKKWRTYSRSNRTLDIEQHDFRLVLLDASGKELFAIEKFNTLDKAKIELDKLCNELGI
ncbi:MAG: hypothetical protein GYA62_09735 [Bacteroidales bacterium]|nr:hypothetical protein [Bacteroidales bacterium]